MKYLFDMTNLRISMCITKNLPVIDLNNSINTLFLSLYKRWKQFVVAKSNFEIGYDQKSDLLTVISKIGASVLIRFEKFQ